VQLTTPDGVALHVQELGAGSERPCVVMLHGLLLGTLASWYFTAAPSVARSRRVVLYDLRGHGRSDRARTGYDAATMARDLGAVAERLGDEPIDLVGHSFGALVALRFTLDEPARVRRLVLVEAPLPPSKLGEITGFLRRTPEQMLASLPGAVGGVMASGGRRAARLLDALAFLATRTTLVSDLEREPDIPDSDLACVAARVLCVYGDRSACRPCGERLARVIPGARLEVLSGGHFLHLDAPSALTAVLREFLDG
jgi:pimeloyl-ACP methyl ester carboxylesterase